MLATRAERGTVAALSAPGGLIGKDTLAYVDGGTLYCNAAATGVTGLAPGEKQLIGMGAYILIFPDKVYFNTADHTDFGSMEADITLTGAVSYCLCDLDGAPLPDPDSSAVQPENPENAALWLDADAGTLYQYSSALSLWTALDTVYTRMSFPTQGEIPRLFSRYDGVEISGAYFGALNSDKALYAVGGEAGVESDYIVLAGLIGASYTQTGASVRLRRRLPPLDFVCQSQNRLWGCFYGVYEGRTVNEICCSALGDFKNWRQYLGLATDSWAASVGSDGEWTGAVNYLGAPCFFKEDGVHRVTVSAAGAHRVTETVCRGVQKGSAKSLRVVGESLYYKARGEVCVWQGGFPQSVSQKLGDRLYYDAAAGTLGGRYYISMRDAAGSWSLFTLDTERGIWYREDALHALYFAEAGGELYCVDADGALLTLGGSAGEREGAFAWSAETGEERYSTVDRKYLSRFNISLRMAAGATLRAALRYDSSGVWEAAGEIAIAVDGTVLLPVRPRRCDHVQLRLSGTGEVKIFSIARILEQGSDM